MNKMIRRTAFKQLSALAATLTVAGTSNLSAAETAPKTSLGIVMYDCKFRRKWMQKQDKSFDLYQPFAFLEHCRKLGAGGAHMALGVMTSQEAGRLRELAQQHGMFIDAILSPPEDEKDLPRFQAEIKTAHQAGVQSARTVIIPGRRYERFKDFGEFQEFEHRGRKMVELAVPILEKHQVALAIENHKDQRIEDRLDLYEHIDSEYVGACVDTGNSISLLDDAYGTIEALAPHAFSVHFKDQSLIEYEDGFLLGDIPLGQGSLNLPRMMKTLRSQKPDLKFSLEVITRDPLKVPCLTEDYWKSVPDAGGADLAQTLRLVRQNAKRGQSISTLSAEDQVRMEDDNVVASLRYAREELSL